MMGSYEPALKKARPYEAGSTTLIAAMNGNGVAALNGGTTTALDLQAMSMQLNGDQECRRYNSPKGCPYGSKCRFKYGPTNDRDLGQLVSALGSKTKPCIKFFRREVVA